MEWINQFNKALGYLEERLTQEIDYKELAKIACCSTYHFQRMFSYMANVSLSEYIRRRRMSLAAEDLLRGEKVLDVSIKYGYASPTAFNRAFKAIHGTAPSLLKDASVPLKTYPPISFQITIKGVEEMNYRIEQKESFRIVGIAQPLKKKIEENFTIVPQMWQQASMNGSITELASMMNGEPAGLLGVSICNDSEDWRYFIAVASSLPVHEIWEEYFVPASAWAVFSGSGTNQSIQELEQRIITEWLPSSSYEYGDAPDIEVYLNPDPQNAQFEVWIPVKEKQQNKLP